MKMENELEYFSDEEFNFYKNKSDKSNEGRKSHSNRKYIKKIFVIIFFISNVVSRSFKNDEVLLQKSVSCKSGEYEREREINFFEDEVKVNSYSNEVKRTVKQAKLLSCSHLKRDDQQNSIVFKSIELKEIIEIINKKPKNEIVPPKAHEKGACCGFKICKIF